MPPKTSLTVSIWKFGRMTLHTGLRIFRGSVKGRWEREKASKKTWIEVSPQLISSVENAMTAQVCRILIKL